MTTLARIASALIAASSLLIPLAARAETKAPPAAHHRAESAFPMQSDAFKKLVDDRIDRLKAHLERGLSRRSLTAEQKSDIEKAMDGAVKDLHAAIDKVSAAGTVTREEAKQIKTLSEQLRTKMRAELRGKHASSKAKGGKRAKRAKAAAKKQDKDAPATPAK